MLPCAIAEGHTKRWCFVLQVHKILGPGNQYVTAAKMMLQNSEALVAMDMPAGPSEVLVIADGSASPRHVAADLLSQAEHGPDSQVCAHRLQTLFSPLAFYCAYVLRQGMEFCMQT